MNDYVRLCVLPRCHLCQFCIEDGETAIARIDDKRNTSEFSFLSNDVICLESINIRVCSEASTNYDGCTPCFHSNCLYFSRRIFQGDVTSAFLDMTRYAFRPPATDSQRRFSRTCNLLWPKLKNSGWWSLGVLPSELLWCISKLLVRECTVVTAQEQRMGCPRDFVLDLSHNFFAQYQLLDGVRYLHCLQNGTPSNNGDNAAKLVDLHKGVSRKVLIAEDHPGIRLLCLVKAGNKISVPNHMAGVWWRDVSCKNEAKFRVNADGYKIRDLKAEDETNNSTRVSWATTTYPSKAFDLFSCHPYVGTYPIRMQHFDCNAVDTIGYSVATNGLNIVTIHAHLQSNNSLTYEALSYSFHLFWIYMPMGGGEILAEICRQYGRNGHGVPFLNIMFITNKGRSTVFGYALPYYSVRTVYLPP